MAKIMTLIDFRDLSNAGYSGRPTHQGASVKASALLDTGQD